jgi:hypothetical protein
VMEVVIKVARHILAIREKKDNFCKKPMSQKQMVQAVMVVQKVARSQAQTRVAHRQRAVARATAAHLLAVVEIRRRKTSHEAEYKRRILTWD